jgi:ankyrin repeat protein
MDNPDAAAMIAEVADGRTDLVFELLAAGCSAGAEDSHGVSLIQHCAYYGDVSAIKLLLSRGETLDHLGENLGLNAASFHGHWRLCKLLLERGARVNEPLPDTGETPMHAALCNTDRIVYDRVLKVLLSHGANPNCATKAGVETGGFMRDSRTKGETPLHRAAAFGESETIKLLLEAGAQVDARDANGDTPLSWASWHLRPAPILRQLCYGDFRIRPQYQGMRANLLGTPHRDIETAS